MRIAGIVLAAGAGTRLRPLTERLPKPLVPVLGHTLLDRVLAKMAQAGAERVFVNTHVGAELVASSLEHRGPWVRVRREDGLTGPAGALRLFAADLADYDLVLVCSGDLLFDDGLEGLVKQAARTGAALTFGTTTTVDAGRFGVLDVDGEGFLAGAREKPRLPAEERHTISAGVYCLRPWLAGELPPTGVIDYVADVLPVLAAKGMPVATHPLAGAWADVGSPSALREATLRALRAAPERRTTDPGARIDPSAELPERLWVGPSAVIGHGAVLRGAVSVERGARVGANAWVEDSVLLPGAVVDDGAVVIGGLMATRAGDGPAVGST